MRKTIIAGAAVLALAGSTAVYAQHRHGDWQHGDMRHGQSRMNPEDRLAFVDARIAAVKAGLKLTPDQDKLWPSIESAVRDFAKARIEARIDRANASADQQSQQQQQNPVDRLRERADRMTTIGASLKRIADAADPLYKTLDEGQKRRLAFLTHMGGHRFGEGWRERFGRGGDRDDHGGTDRGFHDHGGRDGDHDGGPERL